jgi:hypothetical protein
VLELGLELDQEEELVLVLESGLDQEEELVLESGLEFLLE